MQTFKKLPVVIEAKRFETNNEPSPFPHISGLVEWINSQGGVSTHNGTAITIQTLEGDHRADVGDWIIRGVKGEFYPCKADIFAATYEPAPASEPMKMAAAAAGADAGPDGGLSFGQAIAALRNQQTVCRAGWNGKGMFLFFVFGGDMDHPALPETATQQDYLAMKTATGTTVPWLASQSDILANDWQVVGGPF